MFIGIVLFYLAAFIGITEGRSFILISMLIIAIIINAGFYGFGPFAKHFKEQAERDNNEYNESLKAKQPWE